MGNEDGDAVLESLREKVAQGTSLTRDDQVGLIFSPLTRQGRTLAEVLPEATRLTSSLPREDRELTVGALLGLAYHNDDIVGLRVALLGGLRVEVGGRVLPEDAWPRRKAAALLKLLALPPTTACSATRRSTCSGRTTTGTRRPTACTSALHALRRALEPALASRTPSLYLRLQGESLILCPLPPCGSTWRCSRPRPPWPAGRGMTPRPMTRRSRSTAATCSPRTATTIGSPSGVSGCAIST